MHLPAAISIPAQQSVTWRRLECVFKRVGTRSDQSSQAKFSRLISYIDFDKLFWRFTLRAATGPSCVALQPRQETDQEEGRPLRWVFYGGLSSVSFFVCEAFRRVTFKQTPRMNTHTHMCKRSKECVWKTLKGWFPQNWKVTNTLLDF